MARRLPNLNQLRAFEAAARHLSFKDAAEELFVTQAAISHQIKALEQDIGHLLFHRRGREVALTERAGLFSGRLSVALDEIAAASAELKSGDLSGTLKISATMVYANRMIVPHLKDFAGMYPDLKIEFEYSYGLEDFKSSDIDAGLRHGLGDWPGLVAHLIHYDRVTPICAPTLMDGFTYPMPPEKIAELPLATIKGYPDDWSTWFSEAGVHKTLVPDYSEFQHRGLTLDYALAGNGVALADIPLIQHELATGFLVRLNPKEITLDRGIHLVYPDSPHPDERLVVFADWLKTVVSGIGES